MCSVAAAGIGLSAASGVYGAYSQMEQAKSQQRYYEYLAGQNELQAKEALKSGDQQVGLIQDTAALEGKNLRRTQRQVAGSQKAALAANGVPLSSVSTEDLARDAFKREEIDAETIRYNADVKSWETTSNAKSTAQALRAQAVGYRMGGSNAIQAGRLNATGSLLGTATSVADQWYRYGQTSQGKSAKAGK